MPICARRDELKAVVRSCRSVLAQTDTSVRLVRLELLGRLQPLLGECIGGGRRRDAERVGALVDLP